MEKRVLICITTCNRLHEVKKYIIPYLKLVYKTPGFHFLLSLDGTNKEYEDFCSQYKIPLLYSNDREGVGISKNRVLKRFPDYDYYFFIEDDIELFNEEIFRIHISLHHETGIHHFGHGVRNIDNSIDAPSGKVNCGWFGGAQFNFFTAEGLRKCGGWDTLFAKYKRFGHTEHSYRFYFNELNPRPFCVLSNITNFIIVHDPPHVVHLDIHTNKNELIDEEQQIIDNRRNFFPLQIISKDIFNGMKLDCSQIDSTLLDVDHYYFLSAREKRIASSNFHFYLFTEHSNGFFKKMKNFCKAFILYPSNNQIKHYLKNVAR